MSAIEAILRRERVLAAAGLVALTTLAWLYLLLGAGMGMSAMEMTRLALFPHLESVPMESMSRSMDMNVPETRVGMGMGMDMSLPSPALAWMAIFAMWWVMMIAMMTPSAAPLVLLYGRVLRHHQAARGTGQGGDVRVPSSFFLALGYLAVWLLYSALAATLQVAMQDAALISSMLSSQSAVLSAAVLLGAGLYQLSPLKRACLEHCRSPVEFLTRHWRPGRLGAIMIGVRHGIWCVGCCWLLMALLFVGGVMNLAWIAAIALLVLAEKLAQRGPLVGGIAGIVLVVWGLATLAV